MSTHIPVLLNETMEQLAIQSTDIIFEGTIGYGGHAQAIMNQLSESGHYIGTDQDHEAIRHCKQLFNQPNTSIYHSNFQEMATLLKGRKVSKILIDLGLSSVQLDHKNRGFTFQVEANLDMRMNQKNSICAKDILNSYSASELELLFSEHSQIRNPKFINKLVEIRTTHPFQTTGDLIQCIKQTFYFNNRRSAYIQTLQKVFQALRIEVNKEFDSLINFLNQVPNTLTKNGRIAIITFHSGEDKRVKSFFNNYPDQFKLTTKRVIKPSANEKKRNPRSRSAKLRCYEKML